MKKLTYLLSLVALLSLAYIVKAVDAVYTIPTATITSLQTGPIHLYSLEVINNHPTNPVSVWFYDAPTNSLTYSAGGYTNYLTYTTNIVITTTNYQGVVQVNTNLATFTIPNVVAANATKPYRLFKAFTVASGDSVTWQPLLNGVYLSYGLTATNNDTNIIVNATFSSIH